MPITHEIIKDIGLIMFISSGPASAQEVIDLFNKLQANPDFSFSYDFLWDARERTVSWTAEEIRKIERYMSSYVTSKQPKPKRAFLISRNVDFGMGRVYESYRSGKIDAEMRIFKDRAEALTWLGIQDHPIFRPGGRCFE